MTHYCLVGQLLHLGPCHATEGLTALKQDSQVLPGSICSWKLVKTIPGSEWRFKTQTCLQLAVEQAPVRKFAGLCLDCNESSLLTQWGMFLWEALHEGCSGNEIRAIPRLHTKCLWCRQEGFVIPSCKHLQNPSGQNGTRRIAKISVQL